MIFKDTGVGKWDFRIVEMENGDFVLQTKLEFTGGSNASSLNPPYIWHEGFRGTLKEVQAKRIELDPTYRTDYKTIKRVVEE